MIRVDLKFFYSMEDESKSILMNLYKEVLLVSDLEPDEPIIYDAQLFEDEAHIFYLEIIRNPDVSALQAQCDSFRNHFTLFTLLLKQQSLSSEYKKSSTSEYLASLTQHILKFIKNSTKQINEEKLLINLIKILEKIKDFPNAFKTFVSGSILKETSYLQEILSEIPDFEPLHACNKGKSLIA